MRCSGHRGSGDKISGERRQQKTRPGWAELVDYWSLSASPDDSPFHDVHIIPLGSHFSGFRFFPLLYSQRRHHNPSVVVRDEDAQAKEFVRRFWALIPR